MHTIEPVILAFNAAECQLEESQTKGKQYPTGFLMR